MLRNYFITAWRNIFRGKSFSVINIAGLATGMAGAILILLWVHHEISFDKFHPNKDRLYEAYGLAQGNDGSLTTITLTEKPLGPALKQGFPEVENTARLASTNNFLLTANDVSLTKAEGNFVDPSFLQLFDFPLNEGIQANQLKDVHSIVITENLAKRLFGPVSALGKTIRVDSTDMFTVTGVLKDLPSNTRFHFDYLLPWDYMTKLGWDNQNWLSNSISTFVLLKPQIDLTAFNNKIRNIARASSGNDKIWTHFLFPLDQWHLYAKFENGKPAGGLIETIRLFIAIAGFILLIACINFMNLSTARSEKRSKEVGIRKVAGAGKGLLISQFIGEALLLAIISGVLALLIVQMVLPPFNALIGVKLSIPYDNILFWLYALGFVAFTGLLAGCYPAFYLSSFNPVKIFKGDFKNQQSLLTPRKVLVVLQFSFAVILIISTIVVRNQIQYGQDRNAGYSREQLIRVDFNGSLAANYPMIKNELIRQGIASSVTKTMTTITELGSNTWGLKWPGKDPSFDGAIALFSTDADLVKTGGLTLLQGRDIDITKYPGDSTSVMLNETAVRTMGFKEPIGQLIQQSGSDKPWTVVGVVKDYIVGSPYAAIPPMMIEGPASWFNSMHIRLNNSGSVSDNLAKAEGIFKKYNPSYPFDYQFIDQEYARLFNDEQRTNSLAGLFAALSIFISCLGLFGLSAYIAESRIKEIGIRKVLGASAWSITELLSVYFIKLVFIAVLISIPIAWFAMDKWLEGYNYRIELSWEIFALSAGISLALALLTVSFQSVKAALTKPVLRD
ncbi:MAG: ABC transporter permease [Citrobacter freundii]|nr:MAG: ABC transporter permease [Citrobacter freundii]